MVLKHWVNKRFLAAIEGLCLAPSNGTLLVVHQDAIPILDSLLSKRFIECKGSGGTR